MTDEPDHPEGAVDFQCPYCPCKFLFKADAGSHMRTFGYDKEQHYSRWRQAHRAIYYPESQVEVKKNEEET